MYCVIFCQSTHHFSYQERREAAKERKVYEVWTGGGWTGQEKWRLRGQTYFSFCSVVSLFLSDFYSCLFLSVFLQKYSRVLSAEVHIRVERLSELEAAKKKHLQIYSPRSSSVCLCYSFPRRSKDLSQRINPWSKCEQKGRLLEQESKQDWRSPTNW